MAASAQTMHRRLYLLQRLTELHQLLDDPDTKMLVAEFLSDPDSFGGELPGPPELDEFMKAFANPAGWESYYQSFG